METLHDAPLPPYVYLRKGNPYFERRGYPSRRIFAKAGTPEFEREYQDALLCVPVGTLVFTASNGAEFFRTMERGAKSRARKSGRVYDLPPGWMREQFAKQKGRCAISGIAFTKDREKHAPWAPSIDRIKSSLGYTPDNCQLVCYIVNCGKNQFHKSEFLRMCTAVSSRGTILDHAATE